MTPVDCSSYGSFKTQNMNELSIFYSDRDASHLAWSKKLRTAKFFKITFAKFHRNFVS
jgi:hypothetical protein